MSHKEKLSGVFPPFMTPFVDDGKVSYSELAENIEKCNDTPLRGYMPLGSNGEFMSLTEAESLKILDVFKQKKAANKTIIAGAGRESTDPTLDFINKIADKASL